MTTIQILLLGIVQGIAELLPVSSSAHVIMAEKLMGLDPASPQMTLLLVMLHTGTMFAVIGYFWKQWRDTYFSSAASFRTMARLVVFATVVTGVVGFALMQLIERVFMHGAAHAEIEQLFGNPYVMAAGLAAAGTMIIVSGKRTSAGQSGPLESRQAAWIGAVQGLCLPFRGFSRSGATISTSLLLGVNQVKAEAFSFALAVVLTPAVILKEGLRLFKSQDGVAAPSIDAMSMLAPSLLGMVFSFLAGWVALRWLSRWLEFGRWHLFGYYCLVAAVVVLVLAR